LESSRCSCSLCSSQGAVCAETQEGLGEVLTRCAGGPEKRTGQRAPEGAPVPFLQNGIVMTDESRLG
jgi:hypothetical protein